MTLMAPPAGSASLKYTGACPRVSITPLEQFVSQRLQHLRAVSVFVQDLQKNVAKYADDGSKVPFQIPAQWKATSLLNRQPQLQRVCGNLEKFLAQKNVLTANLANELQDSVVSPFQTFVALQTQQSTDLLADIYELLQKERAFDVAVQKFQANVSTESRVKTHPLVRSNQEDEENEELHDGQSKAGKIPKLKRKYKTELRRKRDVTRQMIRQRLQELWLSDQQQLAVRSSMWLRTFEVYGEFITDCQARIDELHVALKATEQQDAIIHCNINNEDVEEESIEKICLSNYICQQDMTTWLYELFLKVIPVEGSMVKRLQALGKMHTSINIFTHTTLSSSSTLPPLRSAGASIRLVDEFINFHKLLTVNLLDPICRTLKFSRQKQEQIRKELVEALDETIKVITNRRAKLQESEAKWWMKHGYTNNHQTTGLHPGGERNVAVMESVRLNLGNFGLRGAAVARNHRLLSPRSSIPPGCSEGDQSATTFEDKFLEITPGGKSIMEARAALHALENDEAIQRHEMVTTLQKTSLLSVQTMELMICDYLKHMNKALRALKEGMDKYEAMLHTMTREASADFALSGLEIPASWGTFVSFSPDLPEEVGPEEESDTEDEEESEQYDGKHDGSVGIGRNIDKRKRSNMYGNRTNTSKDLTGAIFIRDCLLSRDKRVFAWLSSHLQAFSARHCITSAYKSFSLLDVEKWLCMITWVAVGVGLLVACYAWRSLTRLNASWQELSELQQLNADAFVVLREMIPLERNRYSLNHQSAFI